MKTAIIAARHFTTAAPPVEETDVLRLRWHVATLLGPFRDVGIHPQFLGNDVPADTNRSTPYRFGLVRRSLLGAALGFSLSELGLDLNTRQAQLLLTKLPVGLCLLPAIEAFLFNLGFARSAFAPPQNDGRHQSCERYPVRRFQSNALCVCARSAPGAARNGYADERT